MNAIVRIALSEFAKAFRCRVGTPSARDFLWLTVFFLLTSFITFVGWSARDGIWDRFEEVLLGALPEGGPPIRLSRHYDLIESIQPPTIDKFKHDFPDLKLVPLRILEGANGGITFPGLALRFEDPTEPGKERTVKQRARKYLSWFEPRNDDGHANFLAYAMPLDSPLWRWIIQRSKQPAATFQGDAPLVVAANRSLFKKYFKPENYRKALLGDIAISCGTRNEMAAQAKMASEPDTLILGVKEGNGTSGFQTFKVVWLDSFPLADQVALILPLATAELAAAADERSAGFSLYLEGGGAPVSRISQLRLIDTDVDPSGVTDFRKMAACLGAMPSDAKPDTPVDVCGVSVKPAERPVDRRVPLLSVGATEIKIDAAAKFPLRAADVATCANRSGLTKVLATKPDRLRTERAPDSARISWVDFARVRMPCNALLPEDSVNAIKAGKEREHACATAAEDKTGVAYLRGYSDAMVYARGGDHAPPRTWPFNGLSNDVRAAEAGGAAPQIPTAGLQLDAIVRMLLDWKQSEGRQVFQLDAAYEGALVRFGVLSTIIDRMGLPLAFGMAVLYLVLLWVILATTFMHRRAQYGLLFMNGAKPWQLNVLVFIQIGMACLVGSILGYVGFFGVLHLLNVWLAGTDIIKAAAMVIGLDVQTFLSELSLLQILWIWCAMTLAAFGIGALVLRAQGISTAQAPIDLIKS